MKNAEFDHYARGYEAGMENPLKQMAGSTAEDFLLPKVQILHGLLAPTQGTPRILDFGCGTGEMLNLLKQTRPEWELAGCDLSQEMLAEARQRHASLQTQVDLADPDHFLDGPGRFDAVYASCVFHHIAPPEWVATLKRIKRLLVVGGRVVIFEHNPWNPATRWVVAHTAIDQNAILLSLNTAKALLHKSDYCVGESGFFLFGPPKWRVIRALDSLISWLPVGGQYFCSGIKAT